MIDKAMYAQRRDKLRLLLQENNLDALLVSNATNRYYLSGFELHDGQCNETSGYLIIDKDGNDLLCTDPRFLLAAKSLWDKDNIKIYTSARPQFYASLIKERKYKNIGIDEQDLSYSFVNATFKGIEIFEASGLVEKLRIIKDAHEIQLLLESGKLNHKLMEHIPQYLQENIHKNITEIDLAYYIECFFRNHGASENAFAPIVAQDKLAALPHSIPTNAILKENSLLLVDVGARLNDYNSDQTRTFWIGDKPSKRFKETLKHVQNAQQAALDIIKAGISCADVYHASNNYFKKFSLDSYFTHSLGHGIGLDTHEAPRLSPNADMLLEAGMLISVEPGLYYSDWGGIRWEYIVLVTENGCEIL